jgi:hypothetical protein
VIGRTLNFGHGPFTIVAVAPKGFTGVDLAPVDVWLFIRPRESGAMPGFVASRTAVGAGFTRRLPGYVRGLPMNRLRSRQRQAFVPGSSITRRAGKGQILPGSVLS